MTFDRRGSLADCPSGCEGDRVAAGPGAMARPIKECSICGVVAPLSYEHVPPERAFNSSRVFVADSSKLFGPKSYEQYLAPSGRFNQRGAGGYTICEKCNNNLGSWYVPAYIDWAQQGMNYLSLLPNGPSLSLPFKIRPLAVLKQIICMFASACGPGLLGTELDLRKLVLDRDTDQLPDRFRVYCSLMSPHSRSSRQSGITGVIDWSRIETHVFSEIAFPPFVHVLAIDSTPIDPGLQDISFFSDSQFGQYRQIHLYLKTREIASAFPGDYRSDRDIRQVYAKRGRDVIG
jgi:hypothetical protein